MMNLSHRLRKLHRAAGGKNLCLNRYKAYFLGLNFRGYPPKIWPNIFLHVLDPGIPIDHFFLWDMMGLFDAHMLYV
jgi:hypothetical protein